MEGLILNSRFIPEEMVSHILSYLDPSSLLECRLVCKKWNSLITCNIRNSNKVSFSKLTREERSQLQLPWHCYYHIEKYDPFYKNIVVILIHLGLLIFFQLYENIVSSFQLRNDIWDNVTYWVPKNSSLRGLNIYLCEEGAGLFTRKIMDELRPPITVSEWYSHVCSCEGKHKISIELLNEDFELIDQYLNEESRTEQKWNQVIKCFENYGPGVRILRFNHGGQCYNGDRLKIIVGPVIELLLPNTSQ